MILSGALFLGVGMAGSLATARSAVVMVVFRDGVTRFLGRVHGPVGRVSCPSSLLIGVSSEVNGVPVRLQQGWPHPALFLHLCLQGSTRSACSEAGPRPCLQHTCLH